MRCPKLSVIIPVYNAAAYLERCVESVMTLPYDKEVILINDGSKDESGIICDTFAKKYCNVTVQHQENQGVSSARNRGIVLATGEKIWFVDADDWVEERAECNKDNIQNSALLVNLGYVWDEAGVTTRYQSSSSDIPYNLWRCWFDRKAIIKHNIQFAENRKYAEDQEFILQFLLKTRANQLGQVIAVDSPIYYYTMRPGSAMNRKNVKTKMVRDVASVLIGLCGKAIFRGAICQFWVWKEIKRLSKNLFVTICR